MGGQIGEDEYELMKIADADNDNIGERAIQA